MCPPSSSGPESESSDLTGYEVLLAMCGGIAAYKCATLASRLVQRGCGVTAAMTRSARRFLTPLTMRALTARHVYTNAWETHDPADQQHLTLTEAADLIIVAPATANIIAKMAAGLGDDLVSTLLLSAASPILMAPAMNTRMWANPIVQQNVSRLGGLGVQFIGPEDGWLACREVGAGRMSEPEMIVGLAAAILRARPAKAGRRTASSEASPES